MTFFSFLDVWNITRSRRTRKDNCSKGSSSKWCDYKVKIARSKPTNSIFCASPGYISCKWISMWACYSRRSAWCTLSNRSSIWACFSSRRSPGYTVSKSSSV